MEEWSAPRARGEGSGEEDGEGAAVTKRGAAGAGSSERGEAGGGRRGISTSSCR